jgi:hypothetical protein
MIGFLFKPVLGLVLRHLTTLLLQALGADLRKQLPEVFAVIDAQMQRAITAGAAQVSLLFFTAVQRVVHRDPSAVELRILTLLFDPAALARREQPTQPTIP